MSNEHKPLTPGVRQSDVAVPLDFTYRMEATFTDVVSIGIVPEGLRIDAHYQGHVIEGPLAGGIVRGVDYLLIRSDGVSVLDARHTITTAAGRQIAVRGQGYGESDTPLPPAEALGNAPSAAPDATSHLTGVAFCQTAAPDLLWLNRTVLAFTGTANMGTRELHVIGRVMTPEFVLGGRTAWGSTTAGPDAASPGILSERGPR